MANAGYRLWGLARGPISHGSLALGAATATQIFDSSNAARTPDEHTKTIVITNTTGAVLYIGVSTVTNTVYLVAIPDGEKEVFDATWSSLPNFWAYSVAGGTIRFGQAG